MSKVRPSTQLIVPGDATKYLDGTGAFSTPPGGTSYYVDRDRTVATGGETTLTLGETPVTNSPLIWKNGSLLWDGGVDYTISGAVATFSTALSAGDVITDYYLTTSPATVAAALGGVASAAATVEPYSLDTYGVTAYG